jgi:hypothetical protein
MRPSNEQFAAAFDSLARSMPDKRALSHDKLENHEWLGEAAGLIQLADPLRAVSFKADVERLHNSGYMPLEIAQRIAVTVMQFRTEFRLKTMGPLTVAFESGQQFSYFDEIRQILEAATSDVLVVDPYLGADFISRYLPHVKPGVPVRLLVQNQVSQVRSAAEMFSVQHGTAIETRRSDGLHDRYIFINGTECYHSGATFKDGAVKSPTTLTQITDAFEAVRLTYENAWSSSKQ